MDCDYRNGDNVLVLDSEIGGVCMRELWETIKADPTAAIISGVLLLAVVIYIITDKDDDDGNDNFGGFI